MTKNYSVFTLIALLILTGCTNSAGSVSTPTVASAVPSELPSETPRAKADLPEFIYVGMDEKARICADEANKLFKNVEDDADIMIPADVIAWSDESDLSDIRIAANLYSFHYRLENDNLLCVRSDSYPVLLHVRIKEGGGSEVFKMETTEELSLEEMCSGDKNAASLLTNSEIMEEIRKQYLAMYIANFNLPIKTYQDPGKEPVEI